MPQTLTFEVTDFCNVCMLVELNTQEFSVLFSLVIVKNQWENEEAISIHESSIEEKLW